jgi:hypothetical protein
MTPDQWAFTGWLVYACFLFGMIAGLYFRKGDGHDRHC